MGHRRLHLWQYISLGCHQSLGVRRSCAQSHSGREGRWGKHVLFQMQECLIDEMFPSVQQTRDDTYHSYQP